MTHVVCEPCAECMKDRRAAPCVLVCPVDAFYVGVEMIYINPEVCNDCRACVPVCPSRAIFHEDIVPDEWRRFVGLNYLQSTGGHCVRCVRPASTSAPAPASPHAGPGPTPGIEDGGRSCQL